jgi:sugar-specific transcriptional regulator TrmB
MTYEISDEQLAEVKTLLHEADMNAGSRITINAIRKVEGILDGLDEVITDAEDPVSVEDDGEESLKDDRDESVESTGTTE